MPISFSLFIYNIPASQILHARVLFLTNFVQRYDFFQYVVSNRAFHFGMFFSNFDAKQRANLL